MTDSAQRAPGLRFGGEGRRQDYKLTFDSLNPVALLELVKDIIAFANSGGGEMVLGRDETRTPGLPPAMGEAMANPRR